MQVDGPQLARNYQSTLHDQDLDPTNGPCPPPPSFAPHQHPLRASPRPSRPCWLTAPSSHQTISPGRSNINPSDRPPLPPQPFTISPCARHPARPNKQAIKLTPFAPFQAPHQHPLRASPLPSNPCWLTAPSSLSRCLIASKVGVSVKTWPPLARSLTTAGGVGGDSCNPMQGGCKAQGEREGHAGLQGMCQRNAAFRGRCRGAGACRVCRKV